MRVAILSESDVDAAALRVLLRAIRGEETEFAQPTARRAGGWHGVLRVIEPAIKEFHFNRWEVDALVVVLDSDETPVHTAAHDAAPLAECRLCTLRTKTSTILQTLPAVGRPQPLMLAHGLAVPALEAWLRCGVDPHVNEACWSNALQAGQSAGYSKLSLKRDVYGSDRASFDLMRERSITESERLADCLDVLERGFPGGFGALVNEVRGW